MPERFGSEEEDALQFRVLGPLEVSRNGALLRLGGERQRALLAFLLLRANAVVRGDELIDALFDGRHAPGSTNALQVAISRLRRVLDDGRSGSALETRSPGYVLHVDPERFDLALHERLAAEGRRALLAGDAAGAAEQLRQALALWRGPALLDLATVEFAQPEIRRIEELRLAALADRIDADLELGAGSELVPELEALVAANPLQERPRGQLMLALYRAGRQADALAVYRQTRAFLSEELGLEPSRALQELERSILRQEPALEPAAGEDTAAAREPITVCPFKGLAQYETEDAEFFFGRERIVDAVIGKLAAGSFAGVIGSSGVGKSSVLRAGVVAALAAGALPGSARWRAVVVRPGPRPLRTLARALEGRAEGTLVVVVDQLEELFTLTEDEHERTRCLDALAALAREPGRRTLVLVSVRADFYGRFAAHREFAEILSQSHVLVGPMEREELRRAIEMPTRHAGLGAERALVDSLVADVETEPGALPLLSTMLLELWRLRDGRMLRLRTYQLTGGVRGAVARLAEDTYTSLAAEQRGVMRSIMLRLTAGDAATIARRRVPREVIERLAGAAAVLERLIAARLVTVSADEVEVAHEALLYEWPRMRSWLEEDEAGRRVHQHLSAGAQEWVERDRDPADLYRGARLAAALDWAAEHDRDLIASEREFLRAAREQAEAESRRQRVHNRRLRGLLAGALVLLALAVAGAVVALVKQQDAQRASQSALARQLGAEALIQPRVDLSLLLAREGLALDRSTQTEGTLLAALLRSPAAVAIYAMPIDSRPQRVSLRPGSQTLAVSDNTATVRLYDTRTRALRTVLHNEGYGYPVVYSPDGSRAAMFDFGPSAPYIDIFDAATDRELRALTFDKQWLDSGTGFTQLLFFSPDRRSAYLAYNLVGRDRSDGPAYLDRWRLATGARTGPIRIGGRGLRDARLLAGGRLGIVTDDEIEILDLRTLRVIRSVPVRIPAAASAVALSPDGSRLAIGKATGEVSFVDLRSGATTAAVGGHAGFVDAVAWSPDGRVAATAGDDARVIVWDPVSGQADEVLSGHSGRVLGLAFDPAGGMLYSCSLDGTVIAWDLSGLRRFGRPFEVPAVAAPGDQGLPVLLAVSGDGSRFAVRGGPSAVDLRSTSTLATTATVRVPRRFGPVTAIAWSRNLLAVGGQSGSVELWRVDGRPRLVETLTGLPHRRDHSDTIEALAFSPDGRVVAATDAEQPPGRASATGRLVLWRVDGGREVAVPRRLGSAGADLAFSRDGTLLAVGEQGSDVAIVDVRGGGLVRILHPGGIANSAVTFSADGTLLTGSLAGTVRRWDVRRGVSLGRPVLVTAAPVQSLRFSPAADVFATTGESDGVSKLWSLDPFQQVGANFEGTPGGTGETAFTPDGRYLLVVYDNGKAFRWPIRPAAWAHQACAVADRNLTREEWSRFITGRAYAPVCGLQGR